MSPASRSLTNSRPPRANAASVASVSMANAVIPPADSRTRSRRACSSGGTCPSSASSWRGSAARCSWPVVASTTQRQLIGSVPERLRRKTTRVPSPDTTTLRGSPSVKRCVRADRRGKLSPEMSSSAGGAAVVGRSSTSPTGASDAGSAAIDGAGRMISSVVSRSRAITAGSPTPDSPSECGSITSSSTTSASTMSASGVGAGSAAPSSSTISPSTMSPSLTGAPSIRAIRASRCRCTSEPRTVSDGSLARGLAVTGAPSIRAIRASRCRCTSEPRTVSDGSLARGLARSLAHNVGGRGIWSPWSARSGRLGPIVACHVPIAATRAAE